MTEEQIQYIVHIHENMDRQGPGSDEETRKALEITGLDKHPKTNSNRISAMGSI